MEFFVNITIAITVTAIIILLIKKIFKNIFSAKWHVIIWAVLVLQLALFPFKGILPESVISVQKYIPSIGNVKIITEPLVIDKYPQSEESSTRESNNELSDVGTVNMEGTTALGNERGKFDNAGTSNIDSLEIYSDIALNIWAIGFTVTTGAVLLASFFYRRKLKELSYCEDDEILMLMSECKMLLKIRNKNKPQLKLGAETPMLAGIFNPVIYILEGYSDSELKHVLIHELCHYKNKDILLSLIGTTFTCVFWFNPIIWICFKIFRRDLENYCDERAVFATGEKKQYASVLLKTATKKNNFIASTSCMQNGETEVAKRIKKIAVYKKPKLWVSILALSFIVVLGTACFTNPAAEKTAVIGIDVQYIFEAPIKWAESYETIVQKDKPPYTDHIEFYDKNGKAFAGASRETIVAKDNFEKIDKNIVYTYYQNQKKYTDLLVESVESTNNSNKNSYNNGIQKIFTVSGKTPENILVNNVIICVEDMPELTYCIWAIDDACNMEKLTKIARTFGKIPYVETYRPIMDIDLDWSIRRSTTNDENNQTVEKEVRQLTDKYFENYVNMKLPRETAISGYKINSMERVEPFNDKPGIIEDDGRMRMYYMDYAPWDIIYPSAQVYKMDYELIPRELKYYNDFAGGGFEPTKHGNKRYKEAYGVFYSYNLDDKTIQAVFLGFINPSDLAEHGLDYSVMNMIDSDFENRVIQEVLKRNHMDYVGDASRVGAFARCLPMAGYWNGMQLQTKEEPYGLIANYTLEGITGKTGNIDNVKRIIANTTNLTPKQTGGNSWIATGEYVYNFGEDATNVDKIIEECKEMYKSRGNKETMMESGVGVINPYIEYALSRNMRWLLSGIGNADNATVIMTYPESITIGGSASVHLKPFVCSADKTFFHGPDLGMTYFGQPAQISVKKEVSAYTLALSSVRGLVFSIENVTGTPEATYPEGYDFETQYSSYVNDGVPSGILVQCDNGWIHQEGSTFTWTPREIINQDTGEYEMSSYDTITITAFSKDGRVMGQKQLGVSERDYIYYLYEISGVM